MLEKALQRPQYNIKKADMILRLESTMKPSEKRCKAAQITVSYSKNVTYS
jgi:hypothetical protein